MFKNKNKMTKISNAIFLGFGILAFLSLLSIITNIDKSTPVKDLYSNIVLMIIYIICSGIILWITNKKIDLYKEEYSISRQIFNLFVVISLMSAVLMLGVNILSYIFYKKFSLYSLLIELVCFIPIYLLAYKEVSKNKLLNKNNEKKTNSCNLVIIILLMNYASIIGSTLLQIVFNTVDIVLALKNILISFVWIAVILIAYKLINRE